MICCVAGRSGGHILPGLSYLQRWRKEKPDYNILFFSTDTTIDHTILDRNPLVATHITLDLDNIPHSILGYPRFAYQFIKSTITSFSALRKYNPARVVSMGGYVSFPVCLSAWVLNIPIELIELNAIPGKATRQLARFADIVSICFEESHTYFNHNNIQVIPYPVRFEESDKLSPIKARPLLGLSPCMATLFVCGGSQGSHFINELMKSLFTKHPEFKDHIQIIHQTGTADCAHVRDFYENNHIKALVFDYRSDIHICYSAADLVLARAGAGSLFELLFFGTPSLIVPLESEANDHQVDNARAMSSRYPQQFSWSRQKEASEKLKRLLQNLVTKGSI